jgi:hypothetical protein
MGERVAVRQKVRYRDRPRRAWEERLALRFPALNRLAVQLVLRFPLESRLRRRLVAWRMARGFAALNRRDLELNKLTGYHPDAELVFPKGTSGLGRNLYRGRDEAFDAYREWLEPWEGHRRVPREIIELGDKLVVLIEESGRGSGSGIEVGRRMADIYTIHRGLIVKQEIFPDWKSALNAVGLEE